MTLSKLGRGVRCLVAAFGVFALAPPVVANAQPVSSDFEQLRASTRAGDTVYVTDDAGFEIKGKVLDLSPNALALMVDGQRREFGPARVRTIRKRHADPVWQGALIGAGIGMAPFLGYCVSATESGEKCSDQGSLIAMYGALGGGIGAAVDALIRGKRSIYQAPGGPKTIKVSPVFSSKTRAVRFSVLF